MTLSRQQADALEALIDPRIGTLPAGAAPAELVEELETRGLLDTDLRESVRNMLAERAAARPIEWGSLTTTQGDVLAAFTVHCRDELADVDVVSAATAGLVVRWRSEESRFELRNGFVGVERLASANPTTMLLGDVDRDLDRLVTAFLDRPELRDRVAVCDLDRLERLGTVRSSCFVYFEWFLRDAYGVKLVPSPAFTQGLIDRGVISLGMG
jgi:hypothetical protein